MSAYRVCFFKHLLSSDGHQFKCLQQQIDVDDVESAEQARESALSTFAAVHGPRNWKVYADAMEVVSADPRQDG